jgi:hypothetical protein
MLILIVNRKFLLLPEDVCSSDDDPRDRIPDLAAFGGGGLTSSTCDNNNHFLLFTALPPLHTEKGHYHSRPLPLNTCSHYVVDKWCAQR